MSDKTKMTPTRLQALKSEFDLNHVKLKSMEVEMRQKLSIVQALIELEQGAPGKAHETLMRALEISQTKP